MCQVLTWIQLESYYHLSYTVVSLVFLSPLVGYTIAAFLNQRIHNTFGQRGVALLGSGCHLLAYVINSVHPPYPVLVISFIFAGLGNGVEDAAWNAWIGNMANANEVLGFLHGIYGAGAVISPLIATSMIAKGGLPWYYFYYVMVSLFPAEQEHSLIVRLVVRPSNSWFPAPASGNPPLPNSGQRTDNRLRKIKRAASGTHSSNVPRPGSHGFVPCSCWAMSVSRSPSEGGLSPS